MNVPCRATTRLALLALAPMVLGACTLVGGVQPPSGPAPMPEVERRAAEPGPAPEADTGNQSSAVRLAAGVVDLAMESIGTPYEWGGTDANGFDCSGLIQFAYGRFGIQLPRTSSRQLGAGTPVVPIADLLRPGDILGFSGTRGGRANHVGLYVGQGRFIHSSSSGVRVSTLRTPYWQDLIVAARRIVE